MEPQTALVGADGAVELDPEAPVDMDAALVVLPGDPELDDPLRLHQAVHDALGDELRAGFHHGNQGGKDLPYRLVELRLRRIALNDPLHQIVEIRVLNLHMPFLQTC